MTIPSLASATIGSATLYLGDAYEIMPHLGAVDAIVTDPHYEFNASGGGKFRATRGHTDRLAELDLNKGFDHSFLTQQNCRSCAVFCCNEQITKIGTWLEKHFDRFALCQWHKSAPMPVANKHYRPDTEFYFHAWTKGCHPVGQLADKSRYVFTSNGKSQYDHPTVKPDEVMDKIIRNINVSADLDQLTLQPMHKGVILDPFMGTGSTLVACLKAGIPCIGIEKVPAFFNIAKQRLEQLQ